MAERSAGCLFGAALAAVTLLTLPAGTRAASTASRPRCPPPGARILAQDRLVSVFTLGTEALPLFACRTPAGRPLALARARHCCVGGQSVLKLAVAGTDVAYVGNQFGIDSGTYTLVVSDVASRRQLQRRAVGGYIDAGIISDEHVVKLVLARYGAAAWIAERTSDMHRNTTFRVRSAAPRGAVTALDEGPSIAPASLTLSHGELSWSDGGRARSAPLR